MIGLIITGHGEFSLGLGHALEMIAGKQKAYRTVPFLEADPMETLETNLATAIAELRNETDGVVIFADLLGGSPFKAAMVASAGMDNVEVVVGTNLPMLIEIAMFREFAATPLDVVNQSLLAGKEAIQHVQLPAARVEADEDEDGI